MRQRLVVDRRPAVAGLLLAPFLGAHDRRLELFAEGFEHQLNELQYHPASPSQNFNNWKIDFLADYEGDFATLSDFWRERLITLRAYILVCLEHQANPDDLYAAKLKNYRADFDATLAQARASAPDAAGSAFVFSIPLERG